MHYVERANIIAIIIFLLGLIGSIFVILGVPPFSGVWLNMLFIIVGLLLIVVAIVVVLALIIWDAFYY